MKTMDKEELYAQNKNKDTEKEEEEYYVRLKMLKDKTSQK